MSEVADLARRRGYAICTEPRSGSVYLCKLLASTGVLGDPAEFFDADVVRGKRDPDYPSDHEAQLAAIPRLGATPNGVYGLKVFSRHFDSAMATRWADRLPGLRFIHLTRLDALGQAISLVRATQTWQWTSRAAARAEPHYDFEAIHAELIRLLRAQTRWAYYLNRNGLPVLHLIYEQVIDAPQASVDAVAGFMGLEAPARVDFSKVTLAVQRDALSLDWRRRFVERARDLAFFST